MKHARGTVLLQEVVRALLEFPSNKDRYKSTDALLAACRLTEKEVVDCTSFRYAVKESPRAALRELIHMVACRTSPSDPQLGLRRLVEAHQDLLVRRKKDHKVQPLVLRICVALHNNLSDEEKLQLKAVVTEPVSLAVQEGSMKSKVVELIILGNGYDHSLVGDGRKALVTPSPEALAPYLLAQNNPDVFLLTTNLTRIYEYLPSFDPEVVPNFAELYGSILTSVTPQANTRKHKHVLAARDRLKAFIEEHQQGCIEPVKIKVLFLGIGFVRNGEGLGVVCQPHWTRYNAVSFFNCEKMDGHQLNRCCGYLGLRRDTPGVDFRHPPPGQDFATFLAKVVRWPVPTLPTLDRCRELRISRLKRCVCLADVHETAGSVVLDAITYAADETGNKSLLKRKRTKVIYKE